MAISAGIAIDIGSDLIKTYLIKKDWGCFLKGGIVEYNLTKNICNYLYSEGCNKGIVRFDSVILTAFPDVFEWAEKPMFNYMDMKKAFDYNQVKSPYRTVLDYQSEFEKLVSELIKSKQ